MQRTAFEPYEDRHTLGMMQASFLHLIPVLAAIAIFWGSLAGGAPGEA